MAAVTSQATGTNDSYSDVKLSMSIIEWISRILYVALPVMFSVFLGMVGHHAGGAISKIVEGWGSGAARAGSGPTSSVMNTAGGLIRSRIKK